MTAEYTWPGSFRPSRDNWERLPLWLQRKLTKGIVCSGGSTQSQVDSVNVRLHCRTEVSVCTFMRRARRRLWGCRRRPTTTNSCLLSLCVSSLVKASAPQGEKKIGGLKKKKSETKRSAFNIERQCWCLSTCKSEFQTSSLQSET